MEAREMRSLLGGSGGGQNRLNFFDERIVLVNILVVGPIELPRLQTIIVDRAAARFNAATHRRLRLFVRLEFIVRFIKLFELVVVGDNVLGRFGIFFDNARHCLIAETSNVAAK